MNTIAARHANVAPQPLLSAPLRIGTVLAVALVMVLVVTAARHESQQAVRTATGMLSRSTLQLTLPSVEVVGRRERAGAVRGGTAG